MSGRARRRAVGDRGSLAAGVSVLMVAFLIAAGFALDGGRKLGGLGEARDLASNAARAGAQEVADPGLRGGVPLLDPDRARERANRYLATADHAGTVSVGHADTAVVSQDRTTITVTVTLQIPTTILPGPMVVTASDSASAIRGPS